MNRDKVIPIRVSSEEHTRICENATRYGGTVAEYVRSQALHPENGSNDATVQQMVFALSRLAEATNKIENYELHNTFARLEVILWQSIKSLTNPETTGQHKM